jgi:hypothetical protein
MRSFLTFEHGARRDAEVRVLIDPKTEELLTLNQARSLPELRKNGQRVDLSTLYRWVTRGVRGVKLASVQIGGSRCTSREAVATFLKRLTEQSVGPQEPKATAADDAARAERELASEWSMKPSRRRAASTTAA